MRRVPAIRSRPRIINQQSQQGGQSGQPQGAADEGFDGDDDDGQPYMGQNEPSYAPREPQPQPYLPRDAQPFPPRDQQFQNRPVTITFLFGSLLKEAITLDA